MAIIGTVPISSCVAPTASDNPTPSHSAKYGLGGFRGVATLADRNAIPPPRREANMLVYVLATDTLYILQEDLVTWTAKPFGVTKRYRTGYVDAVGLSPSLSYGSIPWTDSFAPYSRTLEGVLNTAYGVTELKLAMPEEWDRSPVKLRLYVIGRGGSSSYYPQLVLRTSAAFAPAGTDYTSLSWGSTVLTYAGAPSAGVSQILIAAITPSGTSGAGNMLFFRIERSLGSYSGKLEILGAVVQWREITSDIAPW